MNLIDTAIGLNALLVMLYVLFDAHQNFSGSPVVASTECVAAEVAFKLS